MFTLQVILSSYYQQILADITKDLCLFPFDSNKLLLIKKRPTKRMCFSNHTLPELYTYVFKTLFPLREKTDNV